MQDIKVIIFDLGDVILRVTWLTKNPAFLAKCSVSGENAEEFFHGEIWHAYEKGQIPTHEFIGAAMAHLGYLGTESEFRNDFCEMLDAKVDRDVFDVVGSLKFLYGQDVELWILSNINELHYNYFRAKFPGIFSSFLEVFLSFELGERKPDAAIFKKILIKGRALPKECLFFDDLAENVSGARESGLRAHRFSNVVGLRHDLASAGFFTSAKTK